VIPRPCPIGIVVEAAAAGVGKHVLELVQHIDRARFKIFLYCSLDRPDAMIEEYQALEKIGVTIRRMKLRRRPAPLEDLLATRKLARMCMDDGVRLLHGQSSKGGLIARLAGRKVGVPVVYTANGFSFFMKSPLTPIYRLAERWLAAYTTRFLCVSPSEMQAAIAAGLPANKMTMIPNGIAVDHWPLLTIEEREAARRSLHLDTDALVIGSIGRLTTAKAYDVLIDAVVKLRDRLPALRLIIWGDGELREELAAQIERLGAHDRVRLAGYTSNPRSAYAAMDIFALPSLWEGAPYVLMEAMACGLPVVVSAATGNRDIVQNGISGLVSPIGSREVLAGHIEQFATQPQNRHRIAEAGRRRVVETYDLRMMVDRTQSLYDELLSERRHSGDHH
jgi:glycosyltransferase involved in cell wall biosynthesis